MLITVLLMLANFLIWEAIARFIIFLSKPAVSANPQLQIKYLVAKSLSSEQDNIVLCGDSLMKAGIYPELITARLRQINKHIRVVNLAVNSGTQLDAISYLEYLRKRDIKPKLVVYDYEVLNTGGTKGMSTSAVAAAPAPTMLSLRHDYVTDGLLSRPTQFPENFTIYLEDCLYLLRHRGNLKRNILEFMRALKYPARFERKAFSELCDSNDVDTTTDGMSPNHRLMNVADQERAIKGFHDISPQSDSYQYIPEAYSPIIDYCQKHHLPLMLLWLPHQSALYQKFFYRSPYTELWFKTQFAMYGKLPGCSTLYLNTLGDDPIFYTDFRHLNTYGCIKVSNLFADALMLPQYHELISSVR